jgi:hypothetical protein
MTKIVRIDNADTSQYKVAVEVWDIHYENWSTKEGRADKLVKTINLDHPTSITGSDCYITSTRYLIVKEG